MKDHEDCKTINHVKINLEDETKVNVLKMYHIKESNTFRDSNTTINSHKNVILGTFTYLWLIVHIVFF